MGECIWVYVARFWYQEAVDYLCFALFLNIFSMSSEGAAATGWNTLCPAWSSPAPSSQTQLLQPPMADTWTPTHSAV